MSEEQPKFINGFFSWYETFYLLTNRLTDALNAENEKLVELHANVSHIGLAYEVKQWTDKFEEKFSGEGWEEKDYYDEIDNFFEEIVEKL